MESHIGTFPDLTRDLMPEGASTTGPSRHCILAHICKSCNLQQLLICDGVSLK